MADGMSSPVRFCDLDSDQRGFVLAFGPKAEDGGALREFTVLFNEKFAAGVSLDSMRSILARAQKRKKRNGFALAGQSPCRKEPVKKAPRYLRVLSRQPSQKRL